MEDTYAQFIAYLDQHGVAYRLIDHAPEGRTELVSQLRGNTLAQAAKCIVLMVKVGKKITKYVLAVVPGDTRVDLNAVKALLGGTYVRVCLAGDRRAAGGQRDRHHPAFLRSTPSWSWWSTPRCLSTTSSTSTRRGWIARSC